MTTKTTHKFDCKKAFKNYDMTCPRCLELAAGAAPRAGYGTGRKVEEARRLVSIKAHNCKQAGCGPVCTAFDW